MAPFSVHIPAAVRQSLPLVFATVTATAAPATGAIAADDAAPSNVYMAGAEVRLDRAVGGDLVVAAGRIHVDQPVGGDAVLGAGSLDVQAPIAEDLRAAGGIGTVAGPVRGGVLIAAVEIVQRFSRRHPLRASAGSDVWPAA